MLEDSLTLTQGLDPGLKEQQGSQGRGPDHAALPDRRQNRNFVGVGFSESESVAEKNAEGLSIDELKSNTCLL